MSNLAQTQAEWTRLFREFAFMLGIDKYLDDVSRKFDSLRNRTQILEESSVNGFTSLWALSGVVFGTNTDESGLLYVRITKDSTATTIASGSNTVNVSTFAGSGTLHAASTSGFPTSGSLSVVTGSGVRVVTYTGVSGNDFTGCTCSTAGVLSTGGAISVSTVALYRAAGGGGSDLMAQGVAAYATTFTLTAQNSSGLSGSVVVATLSGSESDDKHRLRLFPDFLVRARAIFDGSKPEHGAILGQIIATFARMQSSIVGAQSQWQTVLNSFTADRMANFLGSSQKSPVTQGTSNSNGAITLVTTGILEDLRADMVDEATAGAQKVVKNVITASAPVADTHNTGRGSLSTPTMTEWASAGTITLVCSDATLGSAKFKVSQRVSSTNTTLTAKNDLQVGRVYADPTIGIVGMTLTPTFALSSGSTNDFGSVSTWTLTGYSASNTAAGIIYLSIVVNPSNAAQWKIVGYSDSARTKQVFYTDYAAANATVTVYGINTGTALSGTAVLGSAPTDAHTGTLDLQPFVTQNSGTPGVPDKFTIAVAVTSTGEIQRRVAEFFNYALNSATSGSETISEGLCSAGTFPPYSVTDA